MIVTYCAKTIALVSALMLCLLAQAANGQTPSASPNETTSPPSTNVIAAATQFQSSSRELAAMQENEINQATAKLEELRTLVSEGLVAKAELEAEEQKLTLLRDQLKVTQKQIADSDSVIAEVKARQELAKKAAASTVKLVSKQYVPLNSSATMLRYIGTAAWSLTSLNQIQSFFSGKFGHLLPTSAIGQSITHNRLGYDHRNAVDVALHPDSSEGKALISYLQSQGIPFLAFRAAIPGVATGPHIHIGNPSHRLS
ncbi:MAG TPA: hypothetical protein VK208_07090 [Pyrinomonadaceae bacterium]|nr:hypothetical protein [Pyrinomonadaceae bacterium]